jgi:hypothetical protein
MWCVVGSTQPAAVDPVTNRNLRQFCGLLFWGASMSGVAPVNSWESSSSCSVETHCGASPPCISDALNGKRMLSVCEVPNKRLKVSASSSGDGFGFGRSYHC